MSGKTSDCEEPEAGAGAPAPTLEKSADYRRFCHSPATEPGPDGVRVCEKTMQIEDGKAIDVKIIVDHDMIEAFIDEQIAFTYRIYAKPEFETGIIAQDSNVEFYNLSISGK